MKTILIVVPSFESGGIKSSLVALLNSPVSVEYRLKIFIMNGYGKALPDIVKKHDIGCNFWTSKVYSYMYTRKGIDKIVLLLFKLLFKIPWLGTRIVDNIDSATINKIERSHYDSVVSFQEEVSLPFVAKFSTPHKIVWIHSDFSRICTDIGQAYSIFLNYSKIVCVSKYTKSTFCQLFPSLENRVHVIYNIMDSGEILFKSKEKIDDTRFLNDLFTIISVGRIASVKCFDRIAPIASDLRARGLLFKWYILGGVAEQVAYDDLKQSISSNDVDDCVICLGNKQNPYPYFKAADLLVTVSSSEACPMIFNEAKVLNLPILSNDFGSASEFIIDGQDGMICKINELSSTIEKILMKQISFTPTIASAFATSTILKQLRLIFE